ncbi:MAG: proline dehydrogenase family protein [Ignavibacteriales bacterium]|nr:proline dehydrogenase family protein [Ignavibacteriales bacterium]
MSLLNKLVIASLPVVPKSLVWLVAKRYIAGKTLSDVSRVVRDLNKMKAMATVDVLGEFITKREESFPFRDECINVVNMIHSTKIDANLSLKLSQYGLKIDKELCEENLRAILAAASKVNCFTRIDMEDHTCTDATLDIYRSVRKDFPNVGVVIQAYMRRSEEDVRQLISEKANIRLCKGIYREPPNVAFQERKEVQDNYIKLLEMLLSTKIYVGIATHDYVLIDAAHSLIKKYQLQKNEYEFQMLLGVREDLRNKILEKQERIRIYVPYGEHWYHYSTRRFKENPEIAGYVFKAMFSNNNK